MYSSDDAYDLRESGGLSFKHEMDRQILARLARDAEMNTKMDADMDTEMDIEMGSGMATPNAAPASTPSFGPGGYSAKTGSIPTLIMPSTPAPPSRAARPFAPADFEDLTNNVDGMLLAPKDSDSMDMD